MCYMWLIWTLRNQDKPMIALVLQRAPKKDFAIAKIREGAAEGQMPRLSKNPFDAIQYQIFDPLCWWAPFYVRMNLWCSEIVRQVDGWDSKVPPELVKDWTLVVQDLAQIETVAFPRCRVPFISSKDENFEYHVFADSSKEVAAAAVYLRKVSDDECSFNLVAAKTSLLSRSEVSRDSMPRKEIIAMDVGARLLRECLDSTTLTIQNFELWSDSQIVIQWCSEKSLELRIFERNRMNLILKNSGGKPPRYVASECNPAVVATRPFRIGQVERWKLWTRGPAFLLDSNLDLNSMGKFSSSKAVQHANIASPCIAAVTGGAKKKIRSDGFLQHTLNRTNKLSKALQVVCNVAKCFRTWKERSKNRSSPSSGSTENLTDLRAAKLAMIRGAQQESYMQRGYTFHDALALAKENCSLSLHHIKNTFLY